LLELQKITLDLGKEYSVNSKTFSVLPQKKYKISTQVKGIKGEPYAAYFGVVFLDENGKEIDRKIRWLKDFSKTGKKIEIIFKASTNNIIIIYRINNEVPIQANCEFEIMAIEDVLIEEIDASTPENYNEISKYVLPRQEELTEQQELILEKNLVWILGSPRSGTSWFALELLSHQTIRIDHLHITEHLGTPHVGILDLTISRWIDQCREIDGYIFSEKYKNTWVYYLRKLILNRILAQTNTFEKKVILKEPSVTSGADILTECLPNSKIILLLRDGRDIIDSIIDARQEDGFMTVARNIPPLTKEKRLQFIENRAKLWVSLIENLIKTFEVHDENLRMLIRYEDLLTNTFEILKKTYEFLEIRIEPDVLQELIKKFSFEAIPSEKKGKGKFARSAQPGLWKENFTKNEKQIMNKIMWKTLQNLGYESQDFVSLNQSNLFFIIGISRSGTSLLQEIMNTFSRVCNLRESTGGFLNGIRMNCYAFINQFNDFSYLENFIQKNWTDKYFVEKTPLSILCLDKLHERYPKANYIFLKRHPLKIMLSQMNHQPKGEKDNHLRKRQYESGLITKDDLQLNFEQFKAKQILRIVKLQIKNVHLFSNQITIRYEDFLNNLDSNIKLIANTFNLIPNLEKAKNIFSSSSYSSQQTRYDVKHVDDKKAIEMIKQSCNLWGYDYNS